jgi:hypothetical protein
VKVKNAQVVFILVCACLLAAYFQAAVGLAVADPTDVLSWFDGR